MLAEHGGNLARDRRATVGIAWIRGIGDFSAELILLREPRSPGAWQPQSARVGLVRYLGVDLAWGEGSQTKPASRSGVVALEPGGAS